MWLVISMRSSFSSFYVNYYQSIPLIFFPFLSEFLHRAADLTLVPSAAIGRDLLAYSVTTGEYRIWFFTTRHSRIFSPLILFHLGFTFHSKVHSGAFLFLQLLCASSTTFYTDFLFIITDLQLIRFVFGIRVWILIASILVIALTKCG